MDTNKKALICGIGGQDGAFLSAFLIKKGYEVWGTSRDVDNRDFDNLSKLGVLDQVHLISMNPVDFHTVLHVLAAIKPHEVYYLAAQSSVGFSYEQPIETIQSIEVGTINLLEASRMLDLPVRLYFAGSSECFGDTNGSPATEKTPFHPLSPYAVAKASSYWLVNTYRDAYGVFACTGIMFNHESVFRPSRYVTQKIIQAVKRIKSGSGEILNIGRMDIERDWGWAPEYVPAMWLMLQQDHPEDFIIATGKSYSLQDFIQNAFAYFELDWGDHVRQDKALYRPADIAVSRANPEKAQQVLGWSAKNAMCDIIEKMLDGKHE